MQTWKRHASTRTLIENRHYCIRTFARSFCSPPAFSGEKKLPDAFYKGACRVSRHVRHSSNIFVKFSRRSRRFLGGAPRYVLHLRHTAAVKFIPRKKKPSPSRNVATTDMPCQRSDELRRICVTNYINVTKVDVANVTRGIKCLILSALAFIRFQRP